MARGLSAGLSRWRRFLPRGDWSLLIAALIPCGLSLGFRLAGAAAVQAVEPAAPRPALVFNQYLVDLGEIPAEPYAVATFRFTNRGQSTVQVTGLEPSCGCLQPVLDQREYAPGQSGQFTVRVQTAGEPVGQREYSVRVQYTDPQPREAELVFRLVLPERKVEVHPRALAFYQLNGAATTHTVTITDHRENPLQVVSVDCDSPFATADLGTVRIDEAGASVATVAVSVIGQLPPGRQRALVVARTNDPEYPAIPIPLIMDGPPASANAGNAIEISPARLQFQRAAARQNSGDNTADIQVVLPPGDRQLNIDQVSTAAGLVQARIQPPALRDDGSREFHVQVVLQDLIRTTAVQRDLLVLKFSDGSTREVPVTILPPPEQPSTRTVNPADGSAGTTTTTPPAGTATPSR